MNASGYSVDNTHIGDVLITEDLKINGSLDTGSLVFSEAKLSTDLDCDNNNIINCNNLQANTFNGGVPLTNPLSSNLDCSNNTINNCPTVQNLSGDVGVLASNNVNITGFNKTTIGAGFSTKIDVSGTETKLLNNTISCDNQNVLGVNEIHTDNLTSNQNAVIESLVDIDMSNNSLTSVSAIDTLNIGHTTNPAVPMNLTTDVVSSLKNITGVSTLGCSSVDTSSIANTVGDLFVNSNVDAQNNNITNVNTLSCDFLGNGIGSIQSLDNIDMAGNNILQCFTISGIGAPTNSINIPSNILLSNNDIKQCSFIDTLAIGYTSGLIPMTITTDTQFNFSNLTQISNLTADNINAYTINGTGIVLDIKSLTNKLSQNTLELANNSGTITTIHIFDVTGFGGTVNVAGYDYHPLNINTAYIIHGDITLTAGLLFQINCSVKGATIASKIIFDESTKDIQAFRATDNNVYLDSLTISGGGGHFSNTDVGLFNCQNFNTTTGTPPFYGRNKRFRVVNCNILSAYSLGIVYGYGTVNINNNFINGGGGAPTGIYTTIGLTVSSGLSLEFNSNKVVLFRGAQASSTTYMLRFINIDPLLQINAVNISGNILHPRDQERGVLFEEDSKTALGLIASNTFIRTGGSAPLIDYPRATTFDNYNVKELENFEILANAGVIDATGVLECSTTTLNAQSSATFIDLDMPITSINPISKAKRFAYKFIVTGVSGGSYTKGNFLVSVTNPAIYGYIIEQQTILAGTEILYITDMNGIFPDLLNYKEQDSSLTDTGVTSTGLQIGNNSNNIELYYFDKDPIDVQFGIQISYENSSADDEIQFRLELDTGSGYSQITDSLISTASVRANRGVSTTMNVIQRLQRGDLIKLVYRYIDVTTTTIQRITYTGK